MTMNETKVAQALRLALDAVEVYSPEYMHGLPKQRYVKAIREALEEFPQPLGKRYELSSAKDLAQAVK